MMKLTFKLVAATNVTTFDEAVNDYLGRGYKFVQSQPMIITPHEDITGHGFQYSVAMLLEHAIRGGSVMLKDRIIKWAIKQIAKDDEGSYGDMRYLEDVLENEWGEKMFIFSHRLVPINKLKMDAANARSAEAAKNDPNAPMQAMQENK